MTDLRTAAQQALEALEVATTPLAKDRQEVLRAQAALKAALAEPVQDKRTPVRPLRRGVDGVCTRSTCECERAGLGDQCIWLRPAEPAQEPVEPVAYIHRQGRHWEVSERPLADDEKARGWTEEPLYTAPPQRKPLTETSAERTLKRLGYTDCGGEFWKPPLGATAGPVQEPQCNPHPKAPHGFLRNASHNEDRYVCECDGWEPYEAGYQAGMEAALRAQS